MDTNIIFYWDTFSMDHDRREILRLIGTTATASMGAMAGCLGDDDENGGDENGEDENGDTDDSWSGDGTVPSYADWISWDVLNVE